MNEATPVGEIFKAIPAILEEVGAVGKNQMNQQQRYKYRSADDVCDAVRPLMGKHGVFPTKKIVEHVEAERESRGGGRLAWVKMKCLWTFYATDGSSVTTESYGEGMDSFDKATNKAETASMKNALIQVFQLMGHEDSETNDPPPLEYDQDRRQSWPNGKQETPQTDDKLLRKPGLFEIIKGTIEKFKGDPDKLALVADRAKAQYAAGGLTTFEYCKLAILDAEALCDLNALKNAEALIREKSEANSLSEGDSLSLGGLVADAEDSIRAAIEQKEGQPV